MRCCYECGKVIRGTAKVIVPPKYLIAMGLDLVRAYHPRCYDRAEQEAGRELDRLHLESNERLGIA